MFAPPAIPTTSASRVAIFLDCDNANPANLAYAVQVAQGFGRIVVRRGYGNHVTLASKWQKVLMQQSFAPCLQFQYASGKNTADLALAIDVMEVLLEKRADTFVLVTSDSDFVGLSQKIKERGASVYIVGEVKTPESLRLVCDKFFECGLHDPLAVSCPVPYAALKPVSHSTPAANRKAYPSFVVKELALLLQDLKVEKVNLASFGSHLKSVNPSFGPSLYGHEKLSSMLKGYSEGLVLTSDEKGNYWVGKSLGAVEQSEASAVGQSGVSAEATLALSHAEMIAELKLVAADAGQRLSNRLRAASYVECEHPLAA